METIDRLYSTTLQSTPLTHSRLKYLSNIAQTSEDYISRLGLALSLANPSVNQDWRPELLPSESALFIEINEKHLRGRTLFKDDIELWMALILRNQTPNDYDEWRQIIRLHWERGIEILMGKSIEQGDWLRTVNACIVA
jgi:hypothetical protein